MDTVFWWSALKVWGGESGLWWDFYVLIHLLFSHKRLLKTPLNTTLLMFFNNTSMCIKAPFYFEHYPVKDLFCHQTVNRYKRCGSHIFIKLTWSYLFQVSICWEIKGFSEHVRVLGSERTRVVCLQWYLFTEMYEEPTNGVVERLSCLFVPNQGRLSLIGHTHRWEKSNNINVNKTSILRPFLSVRCG